MMPTASDRSEQPREQSERNVVRIEKLTADQRADVERLAELCNRLEGLDLTLNLEPADPGSGRANQFLYYADGTLAGFASLEGTQDPELCVMVHPAHRRKGIGRALLEAAKDECRRNDVPAMILVCDEAAPSCSAFAAAVEARYFSSEYRMKLDPASIDRSRSRHDGLYLRLAGPEDTELLVNLLAAAFGDPVPAVRRGVERGLSQANQRYYIAELRGEPLGTLRVSQHDPSVYITAFGVLPEHQGRGYGRQMLLDTIDMLLGESREDIRIEVETENRNALSLYHSCGFKETTTYGYYSVACSA
jgi:ribosomal protein S18 acetylase RimI-like enzyme